MTRPSRSTPHGAIDLVGSSGPKMDALIILRRTLPYSGVQDNICDKGSLHTHSLHPLGPSSALYCEMFHPTEKQRVLQG